MKRKGNDFILPGLFVDGMMHVPTCDALKQEFMAKYTKDFQITGGGLIETFLGMQVEQSNGKIRLHLDIYIRETLDDSRMSTRSSRRNRSARSRSQPNLGSFLRRMTAQLFLILGSRRSIVHLSIIDDQSSGAHFAWWCHWCNQGHASRLFHRHLQLVAESKQYNE